VKPKNRKVKKKTVIREKEKEKQKNNKNCFTITAE